MPYNDPNHFLRKRQARKNSSIENLVTSTPKEPDDSWWITNFGKSFAHGAALGLTDPSQQLQEWQERNPIAGIGSSLLGGLAGFAIPSFGVNKIRGINLAIRGLQKATASGTKKALSKKIAGKGLSRAAINKGTSWISRGVSDNASAAIPIAAAVTGQLRDDDPNALFTAAALGDSLLFRGAGAGVGALFGTGRKALGKEAKKRVPLTSESTLKDYVTQLPRELVYGKSIATLPLFNGPLNPKIINPTALAGIDPRSSDQTTLSALLDKKSLQLQENAERINKAREKGIELPHLEKNPLIDPKLETSINALRRAVVKSEGSLQGNTGPVPLKGGTELEQSIVQQLTPGPHQLRGVSKTPKELVQNKTLNGFFQAVKSETDVKATPSGVARYLDDSQALGPHEIDSFNEADPTQAASRIIASTLNPLMRETFGESFDLSDPTTFTKFLTSGKSFRFVNFKIDTKGRDSFAKVSKKKNGKEESLALRAFGGPPMNSDPLTPVYVNVDKATGDYNVMLRLGNKSSQETRWLLYQTQDIDWINPQAIKENEQVKEFITYTEPTTNYPEAQMMQAGEIISKLPVNETQRVVRDPQSATSAWFAKHLTPLSRMFAGNPEAQHGRNVIEGLATLRESRVKAQLHGKPNLTKETKAGTNEFSIGSLISASVKPVQFFSFKGQDEFAAKGPSIFTSNTPGFKPGDPGVEIDGYAENYNWIGRMRSISEKFGAGDKEKGEAQFLKEVEYVLQNPPEAVTKSSFVGLDETTPWKHIDAMVSGGYISDDVAQFMKDKYTSDLIHWKELNQTERGSGLSPHPKKAWHFGLSAYWPGEFRANIYNQADQLVYKAHGKTHEEAQKNAQYILNQSSHKGKNWRVESIRSKAPDDYWADMENQRVKGLSADDIAIANDIAHGATPTAQPIFAHSKNIGGHVTNWTMEDLEKAFESSVKARMHYISNLTMEKQVSPIIQKLRLHGDKNVADTLEHVLDRFRNPSQVENTIFGGFDKTLDKTLLRKSPVTGLKAVGGLGSALRTMFLGFGNVSFLTLQVLSPLGNTIPEVALALSPSKVKQFRDTHNISMADIEGRLTPIGTLAPVRVAAKAFKYMADPPPELQQL